MKSSMKQITIISILLQLQWLHGVYVRRSPSPLIEKHSMNESKETDNSELRHSQIGDSDFGATHSRKPVWASTKMKHKALRHRPPLFTTDSYWADSDSRDPIFATTDIYYWYPYYIWYPYYSDSSDSKGPLFPVLPTSKPWRPILFTTTPPWWPPPTREPLFPTNWPTREPLFTSRPQLFPRDHEVGLDSHKSGFMEEEVELKKLDSSGDDSSGSQSSGTEGVANKLGPISALTYPNQDFVCSPACSMMPLGKLALGAGGKTANQLYNALGVSGPDEISKVFRETIKELQFLKGVRLNMASSMFVAPDITVDSQYEQLVKTVFKNSVISIKAKDPIGAANEINQWVSKETNGKINNVIMSNQLSRTTKIVLVNAISFHGTWKHKFGKPEPMTFHSPDGDKQIPFISVKGSYRHTFAENLYSEIISIPYFDASTFMVILLPKTDAGVSHVLEIAKKNPTMIHEVIKKAPTAHNLYVSIPKFKIRSPVNLDTVYKKLKINKIFESKRNGFNAICSNKDVFVTAAVQKAIFEVTEEGKEGGEAASSKQATKGFVANRPFYFVVFVNGKELISGQFYGTSVF